MIHIVQSRDKLLLMMKALKMVVMMTLLMMMIMMMLVMMMLVMIMLATAASNDGYQQCFLTSSLFNFTPRQHCSGSKPNNIKVIFSSF